VSSLNRILLLLAIYLAVGALVAEACTGNHAATCANEKCEVIGSTEVCTQCKAGGVPIDGFCRPSTSPQAITAGCTGSDGAALTDASTACGMCSGGFFLFRGGCYSTESNSGSEICTTAEGGRCTTCKTEGSYIFQNRAATVTLGNECILCSDITSRDGYQGVANCNKCTAPGSAGAATCSACQDGYYKAGDACTKCDTNCATCSGSGASACTSCPEGKYLKDTGCVEKEGCTNDHYPDPASGKCISCSAATSEGGIEGCTACKYNTTVSKPQCTACNSKIVKLGPDGTTTCVTAGDCAQNDTEGAYFLTKNSDKCLLCYDKSDTSDAVNTGIEGCGTCKKAAPGQALICTACIAGYYNSGTSTVTCTACGANCATCTQAGDDKCDTCKQGYLMKGNSPGQCFACDDANNQEVEGCAQCNNDATPTCTNCKPNYRENSVGTFSCTKTCENPTACGAIVVGGDGSMTHYCSQCRQQ
ncbi:Variant-specific surface protein, partial [Giardia duodenalis]